MQPNIEIIRASRNILRRTWEIAICAIFVFHAMNGFPIQAQENSDDTKLQPEVPEKIRKDKENKTTETIDTIRKTTEKGGW